MVNYANGKVYRLVNNVDEKFYIGSTCNPLHKRKNRHKRDAVKSPTQPVYKHLNIIGWENVEIILIESFPCNSKAELEARERYWIELMKPALNKAIPTRTPKNGIKQPPKYSSKEQWKGVWQIATKFCSSRRNIMKQIKKNSLKSTKSERPKKKTNYSSQNSKISPSSKVMSVRQRRCYKKNTEAKWRIAMRKERKNKKLRF